MLTRLLAVMAFVVVGVVAMPAVPISQLARFPTATAPLSAEVILYQDSQCAQAIGEPLQIPIPSSTQCQSIPANPPLSIIFNCVSDAKNTNFNFLIYNGTADCTGTLTAGIQSNAATGSCAATTLTADGQVLPVFGKYDCSATPMLARGSLVQNLEHVVDVVEGTAKRVIAHNEPVHNLMPLLRKMKN